MNLIQSNNATDAMFEVFKTIHREGQPIGKTQDLLDVHLILENPLHSFTYMRKQHWIWALQEGSDRLNPDFENPGEAYRFRPHWQKKLAKEKGEFCYTYGEIYRAQIPVVLKKLKSKQTREAIINMWDSRFLFEENERTPCTLTLHFLIREDKLHLFVNMRTNDAINLLPYDIWHHCLLQRYIAAKLGLGLGQYHHHAAHMYVPKRRMTSGNLSRAIQELAQKANEIDAHTKDYYTDSNFRPSHVDGDMRNQYLALTLIRQGDLNSALSHHELIESHFVRDWSAAMIMAEGNARGYKPCIPVVLSEINFILSLGYHLRGR